MENKWIRSAIPALLIHLSVGSVYCWSTFKGAMAAQIGMSSFAVGWAFSLAIFFLGMSAAFAGRFVEYDVSCASVIACVCFTVGMIGTGLSLLFFTGPAALLGICFFYGVLMGIGLGIGYIVPIKALMIWFSENKGLATGISMMGLGLAKAIATPIMCFLLDSMGIVSMFCILGAAYSVLHFLGHLLLRMPGGWENPQHQGPVHTLSVLRRREFWGIWLMFFLNNHCGLMILSCEKQMISTAFASTAVLGSALRIVPSLTAAFNALGCIACSTLSDRLEQRSSVYKLIFVGCFLITLVTYLTHALSGATTQLLGIVVLLFLMLVSAGFGGGFSTLPALLTERFGMRNISQLHGLALSAWAIAGVTGNNCSEFILQRTGMYENLLLVCAVLYAVALLVCSVAVGYRQWDEAEYPEVEYYSPQSSNQAVVKD